ncbi:hypothetical protein CR513_15934, partial [Mucuna pruriens]
MVQLKLSTLKLKLDITGICTSVEHPTNMCPILEETELESIECVETVGGGYQYEKHPYPNQTSKGSHTNRIRIKGHTALRFGLAKSMRFGLAKSMPDSGKTVGRHYKSDVVSQFRNHHLTNDSESKRGRSSQFQNQPKPRPNGELIPEYSNRLEAFHCHSLIKQYR